jgi:hypothetical protein
MTKTIVALALLLGALPAYALLAVLIASEPALSPSGTGYGWNCTYRTASGGAITMWFPSVCPPTVNLP